VACENAHIQPDLVRAGLNGANLSRANLSGPYPMGANAVGAQAVRLEGVVSGCPMPSVRAMILFANDRWCSPSGPERVAADLLPANSGFGSNRK
jgi:uncharacterized protein YjbI with pentapeptide repeats